MSFDDEWLNEREEARAALDQDDEDDDFGSPPPVRGGLRDRDDGDGTGYDTPDPYKCTPSGYIRGIAFVKSCFNGAALENTVRSVSRPISALVKRAFSRPAHNLA
ncbi:MAG: hypothetical protein EBX50_19565 [Chitinophagia bacterium]|nr:hypothetical protein [Chitinophagia bacterium]